MKTYNFEQLNVWQQAHSFVLDVYNFTKLFPKDEIYGLTSQFKRAAVSIPANIAEGYRKRGVKDKLRFYNISQGSADECLYYIILSRDLKLIDNDIYTQLNNRLSLISKLLNSYCQGIINKSGEIVD